jgi:hypothetical protein
MNPTAPAPTAAYNMYGDRQEEFGHLPLWAQAEVIDYCHALGLLTQTARAMTIPAEMPTGTRIDDGRAIITRTDADDATPWHTDGGCRYGHAEIAWLIAAGASVTFPAGSIR